MTDTQLFWAAASYAIIMVLFAGMMIGAKHNQGKDADFGDFFMSLLWPISLTMMIGYVLMRETKQ